MKKIVLFFIFTTMLFASVKVATTYTTIAEVVKKIGGELVSVKVLGNPKYDPHFIVPKPSLVSKLRRVDLLVINGAGLEIGWLPPLIKSSHNQKIQPGSDGFLDISNFMNLMNKPQSVSRAFGDIHAQGNPHYTTDPHNIVIMAKVIAKKLSMIDSQNAKVYESNLENFLKYWDNYLSGYDLAMAKCTEKKIIQYHELYNYFLKRYGYVSYGNIEPLPGISPSSKHSMKLINIIKKEGIKKILQDVYHEKKTAKFIAGKTGADVEVIPHDVGAVDGSDTLESFYDTMAERICR